MLLFLFAEYGMLGESAHCASGFTSIIDPFAFASVSTHFRKDDTHHLWFGVPVTKYKRGGDCRARHISNHRFPELDPWVFFDATGPSFKHHWVRVAPCGEKVWKLTRTGISEAYHKQFSVGKWFLHR